jgi:hypothetical protein
VYSTFTTYKRLNKLFNTSFLYKLARPSFNNILAADPAWCSQAWFPHTVWSTGYRNYFHNLILISVAFRHTPYICLVLKWTLKKYDGSVWARFI